MGIGSVVRFFVLEACVRALDDGHAAQRNTRPRAQSGNFAFCSRPRGGGKPQKKSRCARNSGRVARKHPKNANHKKKCEITTKKQKTPPKTQKTPPKKNRAYAREKNSPLPKKYFFAGTPRRPATPGIPALPTMMVFRHHCQPAGVLVCMDLAPN